MYRQIIGYVPSNAIPALVSVMMIYAYTRLLSPAAFGSFSYVFSAVLVLQTSLFYALPIAVMRFFPGAAREGRQDGLLKEAYVIFYGMCFAVIVIGVCAGLLIPLPEEYRLAAWLALPMLVIRSLVQLNQSVNRSGNLMRRYNTVECVHAVLGLGLGLSALYFLGYGPEAVLLGLLSAAVLCSAFDVGLLAWPFRRTARALDRVRLVRLVDICLAGGCRGRDGSHPAEQRPVPVRIAGGHRRVGVYAVAYNLVDRPTSLICASISTATFPLVVQVLENQGREAARLQAGRNGIALLAVTLPACAGLALTADHIAAVLVGPDFRSGVAALLPIMSFTALARGVRSHFIDHAFHLSGRPLLMLWTYGPATVMNIALNIYVVPRYGMMGAAWTALFCQGGTVVVGWFLGTSLFPIWLPLRQAFTCGLALVPMILALTLIRFPLNLVGLMAAIALGSALYVVSVIALDVGEMRSIRLKRAVIAPNLPW